MRAPRREPAANSVGPTARRKLNLPRETAGVNHSWILSLRGKAFRPQSGDAVRSDVLGRRRQTNPRQMPQPQFPTAAAQLPEITPIHRIITPRQGSSIQPLTSTPAYPTISLATVGGAVDPSRMSRVNGGLSVCREIFLPFSIYFPRPPLLSLTSLTRRICLQNSDGTVGLAGGTHFRDPHYRPLTALDGSEL